MIEHIVIVGFGCIGQAVLPLLERAWPRAAITVVDRVQDHARQALVARHGLHAIQATITAADFGTTLGPLLRPGAFLLNLAPSVCSRDLIALAQAHGAFYVDAGIEPWDYEADPQASHLSNYALRHDMLPFARGRETLPTAPVYAGHAASGIHADPRRERRGRRGAGVLTDAVVEHPAQRYVCDVLAVGVRGVCGAGGGGLPGGGAGAGRCQ